MRYGLISCICAMGGLFGGFLLLGAGLLLYTQFENIFGATVRNQMYIDDSVYWWYDVWLQPPAKETLTVHLFEMENVPEWRKAPGRTRPQIRVKGPFVFHVKRTKEKVNFTAEDHQQITFEERTVYTFDELLSYESLEEKATVVNAELMVLNPFILAATRRATMVRSLSKGLNSTINQMLRIYEANLFIERPIYRVIFGPVGTGGGGFEEDTGGAVPTMAEMPLEGDEDSSSSNNSIGLARLQAAGGENSKNSFGGMITDRATLEILKLYDKTSQYFEKLGVDVNPYNLLTAQLGAIGGGVSTKLQEFEKLSKKQKYRFNSMLAFFQNNTLQKFDLFTGRKEESDKAGTQQNGKLIRLNNEKKMGTWFGRTCNEINGTDGRQFGPFVRSRRLYEFNPKICRSVPMQLKDQGVTKEEGINYFRYSPAADFMQSPVKYTSNGCYCRWWTGGKGKALVNNNKRCNYDGILDLGTCYSGDPNLGSSSSSSSSASLLAGDESSSSSSSFSGNGSSLHSSPVILSNPHFSGVTTKSIAREVGGLSPDTKIYTSYMDVEPVSGIVLSKKNKLQFNLHIRPLPLQLRSNRTLRELIIPLFWYEESWALSSEHQNHIKYFFVYPLKYQELAIFGLIGVGICSLLFGGFCLLFCCCILNKNKDREGFKKGDRPILKKNSGKVSPEDYNNNGGPSMIGGNGGAVPPLDEDYDINGYPMTMDDPNAIATYGNQWGTRVHGQTPGSNGRGGGGADNSVVYDGYGGYVTGGNAGYPAPPPMNGPGGGYQEDMIDVEEQMMMGNNNPNPNLIPNQNQNQNYIDNANYVDDPEQTMMSANDGQYGGQGQQPQNARMMMMNGGQMLQQQQSLNGRYMNGYGGNGGGQQQLMQQQMQMQMQQQQQQQQQQQPQYPLERLKRNMPAKQSASTYSMRTLQQQQQIQQQMREIQQFPQQQQQQQQQPTQARQRWTNQLQQQQQMPVNTDELIPLNDEYDYYYTGQNMNSNNTYNLGLKDPTDYDNDSTTPYPYGYRNDSGNDSMQSNGMSMNPNGNNPSNARNMAGNAEESPVGYYETYDEYGRIIPPPSEAPGIEIYSSNGALNQAGVRGSGGGGGSGGGPPPPPPPPPLGPPPPPLLPNRSVVGGDARDSLLAEIRHGTTLRKTSNKSNVSGGTQNTSIPLEDLIAATSTAVVQQVFQQLETRQLNIPRSPPPPPPPPVDGRTPEMRSLDLELLARIITNSPAMQGPLQPSQQSSQQQSRPTTNNFIININQSPGGGGSGGNPLADPQVMMASYLQNVMFQAMNGGNGQPQQQLMFQQQQQQQHQLQQLHQFQQQLALMGGSFGFQQQQQQQALMSALMSHQQSAILPMIGYGNAFGQPTPATTSSFFPNPNIITQQPTTTSFVDSFPSNSSFQLMQSPAANSLSSPYQQQQQENTEMQTGEMLQLSHRLSLHPYIESPALSSSAATSDVASEVGGGGGGTENASSIASTAHPATSVTSLENLRQQMQMHMQMQQQHQQQIQSESVNAAALPDSTVRFYGPYRAYYEPPSVNAGSSNNNQNSNHIPTTATIRNRNSQTATRRPNTTDWDTSFEDDEENDDDDNDDEMKVESVQSSQMKKKYA